jgi:hypothetical protein
MSRPVLPDDRRWQQLFSVMWAIAHIVHLWNHSGGRFDSLSGSVVFVVALATIWRSADARWLLPLAVSQLVDVAVDPASSPDHWNLVAVVNIALLLTFLATRRTDSLVIDAAPTMRLVTVVAYSAAAIAKYNTAFLDAAESCGVVLASIASLTLTERLTELDELHIAISLVAESAVAVGLIIPRLRRFGAVLGITFHFLVSLSPAMLVADFTLTVMALFILFFPSEQLTAFEQIMRSKATLLPKVPKGQAAAFIVFCGGILGFIQTFASLAVLWLLVTAFGANVVLSAFRSMRPGREAQIFRGLRVGSVVPICLVLMLALSPYLGFRTTGVFTMFSNLQTEGPGTNHLFMPSVDLVDWQSDLIELDEASVEPVDEWAAEAWAVPRIDLARRVHEDHELSIVGRDSEGIVSYGPNGVGIERPPWYQRLFATFRPVSTTPPNACSP